jgi:hypothetical protein
MNENRQQVLRMLADGKITVEEAERLLDKLNIEGTQPTEPGDPDAAPKRRPKYLRVIVTKASPEQSESGQQVNIRVPLALLRAGFKLKSLLPKEAQDKIGEALESKGLSLDAKSLKDEDLDELIEALTELTVNVNDDPDVVRICCE